MTHMCQSGGNWGKKEAEKYTSTLCDKYEHC